MDRALKPFIALVLLASLLLVGCAGGQGAGATPLAGQLLAPCSPVLAFSMLRPSPAGGLIAFMEDHGPSSLQNTQIGTVGWDGTGLRIIDDPGYVDTLGGWSPDGAQLVVSRVGAESGIYRMNADGSDRARLTKSRTDFEPAWSPDGGGIAFLRTLVLFTINADGSREDRLTTALAADVSPVWSPDGQQLAIASTRDGNTDIYVVNRDGSSPTRLTGSDGPDVDPVWSPDGKSIAFSSNRDGVQQTIYVMRADGADQRRLTTGPGADYGPVWSPDGQSLAFVSYRDGDAEIYVMRPDGSAQTRLTTTHGDDQSPAWSPDGKYIAFVSSRSGAREIYRMNADGTNQIRLTSNPGSQTCLKWPW